MIADPLLTFVSGVKLDASGTNLYVTVPSTGVLVFDLSPNGVWHRIQVIQDGIKGVADLSGPYDLAPYLHYRSCDYCSSGGPACTIGGTGLSNLWTTGAIGEL